MNEVELRKIACEIAATSYATVDEIINAIKYIQAKNEIEVTKVEYIPLAKFINNKEILAHCKHLEERPWYTRYYNKRRTKWKR